MTTPQRAASCEITWSPDVITLDELAVFMSLLADLHSDIAVPYVTSELARPAGSSVIPASPRVASVRMGSPLITELFAGSPDEWGIIALGMIGYILKNPGSLVTIWPRMQEARYRSKARAVDAQLEYITAQGHLEAVGDPIARYERADRDHIDRVRELQERSSPRAPEPRDRSSLSDREPPDRSGPSIER